MRSRLDIGPRFDKRSDRSGIALRSSVQGSGIALAPRSYIRPGGEQRPNSPGRS